MDGEEMRKRWNELSEEITSGMAEWRSQHPKTTLREIETEIDKHLSILRARMITDTALHSVQAEWKVGSREVVCPTCGAKLEGKGKKKRRLKTRGGQEVELEREYGVCQQCGQGIFPLDEELEVLPGVLTPQGHECLVRLSSWMPFAKAAEMLEDFMGIQVSRSMSQRYTEAAGVAYEQIQVEEVERIEKEMPVAEKGADKIQISADGAMVPLLHGVWAEVRTLVIGEVQPAVEEKGEKVVRTRKLSYFSRKVSAQEFQRLALVEMQRRGVEHAKEVAAIMDGADWEQGFTDYHCPRATRILDFPHAAEHVNGIGEFLHGEHTPEGQTWLKECLHQLKHEGPDELLLEFRALQQRHPDSKAVSGNLAYLEKRKSQMQYPLFQAQGWPIGSGIVESGNKLVVEARLKGAGMHWAEQHVNPMLALRNIICSERWKEEWPRIEARLRQQTRQRRTRLHQLRCTLPQAAPSRSSPDLDARFMQALATRIEQQNLLKKPKSSPWRNFKHGKALHHRPDPPKK